MFYCQTLIRELDLAASRSTSIRIRSKPRRSKAQETRPGEAHVEEGKDGGYAALENATRFPLSLPSAAAKHGLLKTKL